MLFDEFRHVRNYHVPSRKENRWVETQPAEIGTVKKWKYFVRVNVAARKGIAAVRRKYFPRSTFNGNAALFP
jgi:hypothetical protein